MSKVPLSTYVFIDASNLKEAEKTKGRNLDMRKLAQYLAKASNSKIKVFYYTAYPKQENREYDIAPKFNFFTFLEKSLHFTVRKKALKLIWNNDTKKYYEKGNMDVEMTIDAVDLVDKYHTALIFSGDSDFLGLLQYIQNKHKKVIVYSSKNNISNELRTGCNKYIDILKIKQDIWRDKLVYRRKDSAPSEKGRSRM